MGDFIDPTKRLEQLKIIQARHQTVLAGQFEQSALQIEELEAWCAPSQTG